MQRRVIRRLLVVEDSPSQLGIWRRELVRTRIKLCEAADRRQANVVARRDRPDTAIIDLFLAPPDTGIEVVRDLKRAMPDLYCVVVSAHMTVEYTMMSVRAG